MMRDPILSNASRALSTYIEKKSPGLAVLYKNILRESTTLKALKEFSIYPHLFCPDLGINDELTCILSQMYVCLTLFFRIQDCAVDQPTKNNAQKLLLTNVLTGYLLNLLHHFPSKVFDILENTFIEYSIGSLYEINTYSFYKNTVLDSEAIKITDISFLGKKFSPLKIPLAAALLHVGLSSLHDVDSLFNNYGIALQLRNDIIDWEEDYERGQMTFFLSEVLTASFPHEKTWPGKHEIRKAILVSDAVLRSMTLELHHTSHAHIISQRISTRFSEFFKDRVAQIQNDIKELILWKYHSLP